MKRQNVITITSILTLLIISGLYFTNTAQSQPAVAPGDDNTPQIIQSPTNTLFSYQGQLLDAGGAPINNAAMPMTFKLYSALTGGTACWSEDQTVNVQNGQFNILIGQVTAIPDACLTGDIYLELVVNGETLTPRELLTSAAYAVEASTLPDQATTRGSLNIASGADGEGGQINLLAGDTGNAWSIDNRLGTFRLYHDGKVYFSVDPDGNTNVTGSLNMNGNPIQYGLIWPPSYDSRGSRTSLPGFWDTLYYATQRGIAVTVNRNPAVGSLANMFNLHPNSYAGWANVSNANPVEITITYPSAKLLNGVVLSFGSRNAQAIDYMVEYYHDQDDDGVYEWLIIANVTGNTNYETYHARPIWRVKKVRISVTKAGDADRVQTLDIATIQAPSSMHGKGTGPMLDVGGDSMFGTLNMNDNVIAEFGGVTSSQTNTLFNNTAGSFRWIAANSVHVFIDSNNDATNQVFSINANSTHFGSGFKKLFTVEENGNVSANGSLSVGSQIKFGNEQILRMDSSRQLHLLPWGGNGYRFDSICIGCGQKADLRVNGDLTVTGNCTTASLGEGDLVPASYDETCAGGGITTNSLTTGAVVEANLQTPEERAADTIERFSQGDLLCWSPESEQMELCATPNDRLVMAVANRSGKPIVLGAEPVKVIGPVQAGDILVASGTAGYAMVNNNPAPGAVIGQALEDFDGESGIIKAMIRKW